jgi:hypothetical protein
MVSSSLESSSPRRIRTLETLGATRPTTEPHIPEDLHCQQHRCENLKFRKWREGNLKYTMATSFFFSPSSLFPTVRSFDAWLYGLREKCFIKGSSKLLVLHIYIYIYTCLWMDYMWLGVDYWLRCELRLIPLLLLLLLLLSLLLLLLLLPQLLLLLLLLIIIIIMSCIERKRTKFELLDNVWRIFHCHVLSKLVEYYRKKKYSDWQIRSFRRYLRFISIPHLYRLFIVCNYIST